MSAGCRWPEPGHRLPVRGSPFRGREDLFEQPVDSRPVEGHTPVDDDVLPGDEAGHVGAKEHHHVGDIVRSADASHRRGPLVPLALVGEELEERFGQWGEDHPGGHRIHPDLRPVFESCRCGDRRYSSLGRRVRGLAGRRAGSADRGGRHHAAPARSQHVGYGGAKPQIDAGQIDGHQPPPLLGRPLVERGLTTGTRIVEQDADPAHGHRRGIDGVAETVGIGDVRRVGCPAYLRGDLAGGIAIDVDHRHRRPFLGHPQGRGPSDA